MAECENKSMFKHIELNDAKSIVKYGSTVHESIIYLDLNIGEYSTYKRDLGTLSTLTASISETHFRSKENAEKLIQYDKCVCPLHLKLPCEISCCEWIRYTCPYCLQRNGEYIYVDHVYVRQIWYERILQRFLILFIKQVKRKLLSLKKFLGFGKVCEKRYFISEHCLFCYCMGILCIECYNSDRVKGVFIAMNIPQNNNEPDEVHGYFTYHNCISSGNSLPETTDFGYDIIRLLMQQDFYRFIPQLLKCGFSLLFNEENYGIPGNLKISGRRYNLMQDIQFLYFLHRLRSNGQATFDHWMSQTTCNGLTVIWRSIPDALLSEKEIISVHEVRPSFLPVERYLIAYEKIVGEIPSNTTPRSLTHYSRFVIRKAMALGLQLPDGILGVILSNTMPRSLTHYSRLIVRKAMALGLQLPDGIRKLDISPDLESFMNLQC